jgi:sulfite exporter TauE/SafE
MTASVEMGEALALGLASGPACIAACGPVLVPSLLTERAGVWAHACYLAAFLGARLLGYLVFAAVAWELGALVSLLRAPRMPLVGAVYVLLACVLAWYAWAARRRCGHECAGQKLVAIAENKAENKVETKQEDGLGGAAALGLLTGLNLCPPFVAAGIRAAELGSLGAALLFFMAFFVGTSVWFVPFAGLSAVGRNEAVTTVARIAMLLGRRVYGY